MLELGDVDREFLAWIGAGKTIAGFCREHGYSRDWGKWKSRQLRHHFDVETLGEAVAMSESASEGVSRGDFEKLTGLVSKLGEAIEELGKRPNEPAAQQQVREREWDLKDHAKALGLSLDDVERLKGEKEYERFKTMQERLEKEREEAEEEGEEGNGGGGLGQQIRDGLGGIRNVRPQ